MPSHLRSILSTLKLLPVVALNLLSIPTGTTAEPASTSLTALFERTWEAELAADPQSATYLGDTRYNDRWTDLSIAAIDQRIAADRATLASLKAIPRDALTPAEQLDYDLFERE